MIIDPTLIDRGSIPILRGRLRMTAGDGTERTVEIGERPVVIGRDPACDVVLTDARVSAMHAELVATERGVRLRDLDSPNGTFARGLRISAAFLVEETPIAVAGISGTVAMDAPARIAIGDLDRFGALYGKNPKMRVLFARLAVVAPSELTVLVQGETGSGKELVAQAIHQASPRRDRPFVVVDCGAIAPSLAEAILFGHTKGAFTGATGSRLSPFVQAEGGTVFLDELGELPLEIQPKLLRAIAERRVKPVGGNAFVPFDARIVAATRRDLVGAVNEGAFRSDLYFRLAEAVVAVPPLRDRKDDIPEIVRDLLTAMDAAKAWSRVSRDDIAHLLRHDWPGNVRELRSAVSVALAFAGENGQLAIAEQIVGLGGSAAAPSGYHEAKREALARFERGYFALLSAECGGRIVEIARRAGLQRVHVRRYLAAHGLLVPRALRGR